MIIRIAASLFVILGAGIILTANGAVARSGGGFAGRSFSPAPAHPFISPGRRIGGNASAARARAFRNPFFRHRRFGSGLDGAWGSPGYGSYYDPTGYGPTGYDPTGSIAPYDTPPPAYPAGSYPPAAVAPAHRAIMTVIPYRPGCDSQTQKLPWRDGGERSITIVRC